jgi:hypothetical protein
MVLSTLTKAGGLERVARAHEDVSAHHDAPTRPIGVQVAGLAASVTSVVRRGGILNPAGEVSGSPHEAGWGKRDPGGDRQFLVSSKPAIFRSAILRRPCARGEDRRTVPVLVTSRQVTG